MGTTLDSKISRVLYTSIARSVPTDSELDQLIQTSIANNHRDGLTGMLAYWNLHFVQCLEGDANKIEALLARLAKDSRHCEIAVRSWLEVEARCFSDWSMHVLNLDNENEQTYFIRRKYPELDRTRALYRDPMVLFSLLLDLGHSAAQEKECTSLRS